MKIEYVTVHPLVITIGWDDGTTTVVQPGSDELFNVDMGILWAISKKFIGVSEILKAFDMGLESTNLYTRNQKALRNNEEIEA